MKGIIDYYLTAYNDPLIGGVMGFFGPAKAESFNWFRTFVIMEAWWQLPVFLLGMRGLYKGAPILPSWCRPLLILRRYNRQPGDLCPAPHIRCLRRHDNPSMSHHDPRDARYGRSVHQPG